MVGAVTHNMPHVMQQSTRFKQRARLGRKMVHRLKLIEEKQAHLAHVLGVREVEGQGRQPPRKTFHPRKQLTRLRVVALPPLLRKRLPRNLLQQSLANAHARHHHPAHIQITPERQQDQRCHSHHVCPVASHAERLHPAGHIAPKNSVQPVPQERQIQRRQAVLARAGREGCQHFCIPAACHGDRFREIRPHRQTGFQQRPHISPHLFRLHRPDDAANLESGHQPHGSRRQLRTLLHRMLAQQGDLQAPAAEINDAAQRSVRTERAEHPFPAQPGLFRTADHLKPEPGLSPDSADERATILRFARGARCNRAIFRHTKFVHQRSEMPEGLPGFLESFFAEAMPQKNTFAQPQGIALRVQRFDVQSRIGAHDGESDGVRAGVNGRDVNRLRHAGFTARDAGGPRTASTSSREFPETRQSFAAVVCSPRARSPRRPAR